MGVWGQREVGCLAHSVGIEEEDLHARDLCDHLCHVGLDCLEDVHRAERTRAGRVGWMANGCRLCVTQRHGHESPRRPRHSSIPCASTRLLTTRGQDKVQWSSSSYLGQAISAELDISSSYPLAAHTVGRTGCRRPLRRARPATSATHKRGHLVASSERVNISPQLAHSRPVPSTCELRSGCRVPSERSPSTSSFHNRSVPATSAPSFLLHTGSLRKSV